MLGKRFALLACLAATFVGATVTVWVGAALIGQRVAQHQGKPLWLGVCIVALLTVAAGWLSIRLWSGACANGITLMPLWFIETFGALFLIGIMSLLFTEQAYLVPLEAGSIALAMLLVRRQVRQRLRRNDYRGAGS
jgi:hypothetical protein